MKRAKLKPMTVQLPPETEEQLALEARESGRTLDELFASIADEWLRRRALERAEDEEDIREAREILRTTRPEDWLTTEQVMAELGITREEIERAR